MTPLALIANMGATVSTTVLAVAGWQYARQLLKKYKARADRPSKNTARALCGGCGSEFPVGFHTHKLKQGRTVIGIVAHLDAADIELHGLTCKGRG